MKMKYHSVVTLFPPAEGDDLSNIERGMREHGYDATYPIITTVIDGETYIVDGRNRYEISKKLGLPTPPTRNMNFSSEKEIVDLH